MDLTKRQVGMLKTQFLRTPAMRLIIQDKLDDLHGGSGNPRHPLVIQ